jgi:transposase
MRDRFGLARVVLVGDRGMITSARIRKDLSPEEWVDWISALRAPTIQKLYQRGAIQLGFFDEKGLAEIRDPSFPGERLVVCRNPLLTEERARTRKGLLEATERLLEKVAKRVRSGRLRGKADIGIAVGKVINKFKVGKLFTLRISTTTLSYWRNTRRIQREAILDGIYVIRTSLPAEELEAEEIVTAYKSLGEVEHAFRSMKTFSLKLRPIFHWSSDRVRAHIFLCMVAYHIEWHMHKMLAPLLFVDELRGLEPRPSPVAPATRSLAATQKDRTKRRSDGQPASARFCCNSARLPVTAFALRPRTVPSSTC